MSKPSDKPDKSWSNDAHETEGEGDGPSEGEVHRVDTVPPPESGDAYSADTVIRDVPREALEAIRDKKKSSEKRRASEPTPPEEPAVTEASKIEEPVASGAVAKKSPEAKNAAPAEITKPRARAPSAARESTRVSPPVTGSELTIAFAAAIALIIVGFYAINGAF